MKSKINVLALVELYRWILIFTTLCPINPEFRVISGVHGAWSKNFEKGLLNFKLLRKKIF